MYIIQNKKYTLYKKQKVYILCIVFIPYPYTQYKVSAFLILKLTLLDPLLPLHYWKDKNQVPLRILSVTKVLGRISDNPTLCKHLPGRVSAMIKVSLGLLRLIAELYHWIFGYTGVLPCTYNSFTPTVIKDLILSIFKCLLCQLLDVYIVPFCLPIARAFLQLFALCLYLVNSLWLSYTLHAYPLPSL